MTVVHRFDYSSIEDPFCLNFRLAAAWPSLGAGHPGRNRVQFSSTQVTAQVLDDRLRITVKLRTAVK